MKTKKKKKRTNITRNLTVLQIRNIDPLYSTNLYCLYECNLLNQLINQESHLLQGGGFCIPVYPTWAFVHAELIIPAVDLNLMLINFRF